MFSTQKEPGAQKYNKTIQKVMIGSEKITV